MIKCFAYASVAGFLMLAGGGIASAGLIPTIGGVAIDATLTFTDPTGTVESTDSIPVDLTLSLAGDSAALTTDASGNIIGLTEADIDPYLTSTALAEDLNGSDATESFLEVGWGCGLTFDSDCTSTPYTDTFNYASPTFIAPLNLDLQAGDSLTGLYDTLTPNGGNAPAGTYTQSYAEADIFVWDFNLADEAGNGGNPIELADIDIADTFDQTAFTRTVDASAPEPSTGALGLLGGSILLIAMRRKHQARLATQTAR